MDATGPPQAPAPRQARSMQPRALIPAFSLSLCFLVGSRAVAQGPPEVVDLSSLGVQANADARWASLSTDGRFVAFESDASNLVPAIFNTGHVFVRDRLSGTTTIDSVSSSSKKGNSPSRQPALSGDGRFIVFSSTATNLVAGDVNGVEDVFLRDRLLGTTELVSVAAAGASGNAGASDFPSVSDDGRYVAFQSNASNLVAGDANGARDVFVRDRMLGATTLVSVTPGGLPGASGGFEPRISRDGRVVAFVSVSLDLIGLPGLGLPQVLRRDLTTGLTSISSVNALGELGNQQSWGVALSADGNLVAFASGAKNLVPGDTNLYADVFVHDHTSNLTLRVNVGPNGEQADDTSVLSFESVTISGDGTRVGFDSRADLLSPGATGGTDVYVHDLATGTTTWISAPIAGTQANAGSLGACFSGDGQRLAFHSSATDLVAADANGPFADVFLVEMPPLAWRWLGHGLAGTGGVPLLQAQGSLAPLSPGQLKISHAAAATPLLMLASLTPSPVPFKGGTLMAFPWVLALPLATDPAGALALPFTWPSGIPAATSLVFQAALADPGAPAGVALTNALQGTTP